MLGDVKKNLVHGEWTSRSLERDVLKLRPFGLLLDATFTKRSLSELNGQINGKSLDEAYGDAVAVVAGEAAGGGISFA